MESGTIWVTTNGDATTLSPLQMDVALMTGNVVQVFLTEEDLSATLRGIRGALRPGDVKDAPDRPGRELVFIAQKSG